MGSSSRQWNLRWLTWYASVMKSTQIEPTVRPMGNYYYGAFILTNFVFHGLTRRQVEHADLCVHGIHAKVHFACEKLEKWLEKVSHRNKALMLLVYFRGVTYKLAWLLSCKCKEMHYYCLLIELRLPALFRVIVAHVSMILPSDFRAHCVLFFRSLFKISCMHEV